MQTWLNYFTWNRANRPSVPWEQGIKAEPGLRDPLVRSLQKFQLGESGEGRTLRQHAAASGDSVYAAAIEMFVKEEQEHSRLMGRVLRLLNAPLLENHWTDNLFVGMRHRFGIRQEIMVLLLPEMIARCYFRALRDGTRDPVMQAVFAQIVQDEYGHLAFHVEYLRRAFESMSFSRRIAVQVAWRILYRATCLVVMFDHRDVLRAVGLSQREFWRECGGIFDEVAAGIFSPAHILAPVKLATNFNA